MIDKNEGKIIRKLVNCIEDKIKAENGLKKYRLELKKYQIALKKSNLKRKNDLKEIKQKLKRNGGKK